MHSFKKILFLACSIIVLEIAYAYAQTVYVTDEFEVTLRTGPSIENKIIAMLTTGTKLQVIEEKGDWILAKGPNDREGWILKRYASTEIPKKMMLEQLQNKYLEAATQLETEKEKALTVERENKELRSSLHTSQKHFEKVNKDYTGLVAESKDFLHLKNEHASNVDNLKKATSELTKLKKENEDLQLSTNLIWFLSGAGVVAVSWLVGFMMGKVTRRSRSLYG